MLLHHSIFDALIFGFLAADGLLAVAAYFWMRRRANFGRITIFSLLLLAWLVIFYGSFLEPRIIVVREEKVVLREGATEELRIALVSDFHLGPYKDEEFAARAVEKINGLQRDATLIAGDFVYDELEQTEMLAALAELTAPQGVYAVLGNHDYGEVGPKGMLVLGDEKRAKAVRKALEKAGINVLVNASQKLSKNGKELLLIGVDEIWTGRAQLPPDARAVSAEAAAATLPPRIVLVHNPDFVRAAQETGVELVLAGHTHGGQIRLPFIGAVPEIPDELGRAYTHGLFRFGKTQLYITSGIGEMGPRARLFRPPEIVVLKVRF